MAARPVPPRPAAAPRGPVWNGVDGATGRYLPGGLTRAELASRLRAKPAGDPAAVDAGRTDRRRVGSCPAAVVTRAPVPWVDPDDLASSGWGVVFAADEKPETVEALGPLLARRRAEAGRLRRRFYREYRGDDGVLPGEDAGHWLVRHGAGPASPADPDRVPYFLLLAGGPRAIPFEFQFALGTGYAVGRLAFETAEEYARYAAGVLAAERAAGERPRRAVLFGVDNRDDAATDYSMRYLMEPFMQRLPALAPGWEIEPVIRAGATKARLLRLLAGGGETPALLFSTSHGMGFEPDHPWLEERTGALLCGDWPGPVLWRREIPDGHFVAARDVPDGADLTGLVAVHFACYSAGVPERDSFAPPSEEGRRLAPRDLLARLPARLLGKPGGSAVAVLGHVDRARGFSFIWPGAGGQPQTLLSVVRCLLSGERAGAAARFLGERYAGLAAALGEARRRAAAGLPVSDVELADLWVALVDARGYLLLGDPAVRLAAAAGARGRRSRSGRSARPAPQPTRGDGVYPARGGSTRFRQP